MLKLKMEELKRKLKSIDGMGYKAYKKIEGEYNFRWFTLKIHHSQPDPFAPPSSVSIEAGMDALSYPPEFYEGERKIPFEDYINRRFFEMTHSQRNRERGYIEIIKPSQKILKRSSVSIDGNKITLRFFVSLPAHGRRIISKNAIRIFLHDIPSSMNAIVYTKKVHEEVKKHVETYEDAEFIRRCLNKNGLVAFIENGSILPRESGISEMPLKNAVPFTSPETMLVEFNAPNRLHTGMGIKEGVTLIVGGAYHGKSTLLDSIASGVYNHVPGDGREFVITRRDAVKIRAEDGRAVGNVNISSFISRLPNGMDTSKFTTSNASGSTSQAAAIVEAMEMDSKLLLIDEDTSATNLMIRDRKMQELVPKEKEPITPFIDMIPVLKRKGMSIIMVAGGIGEYFDVSDHVIMMDSYIARDVSKEAKNVSEKIRSSRIREEPSEFRVSYRIARGNIGINEKVKGSRDEIKVGKSRIDISKVEQIAERWQSNAIGEIIKYVLTHENNLMKDLLNEMEKKGFISMLPKRGIYAEPRKYEVAAAINRCREINFIQK